MLRLLSPAFALIAIGFTSVTMNSQVVTANAELAVGVSLREKGDYPGAIDHLQRAVALDPSLVKAHFLLASRSR